MSNSLTHTRQPKVSVFMITYNHENYIEQAVRSVMMQQANFDYELVIGEDCSTDSTRSIVLRLKEEFPDKIKLILHQKNVGMISNVLATYAECKGEYIALLEGDDYWLSPKKLQIQVDYLETHSDCSMCFHPVKIRFDGILNSHNLHFLTGVRQFDKIVLEENSLSSLPRKLMQQTIQNPKYTLSDIICRDVVPTTCSVLFRYSAIPKLPSWFSELAAGDRAFWVLLTSQGSAGYINDVLSVYRKHPTSYTTMSLMKSLLNTETDITVLNQYLSEIQFDERIPINSVYLRLAELYSIANNRQLAFIYVSKWLKNLRFEHSFPVVLLTQASLGALFPKIYRSLKTKLQHSFRK